MKDEREYEVIQFIYNKKCIEDIKNFLGENYISIRKTHFLNNDNTIYMLEFREFSYLSEFIEECFEGDFIVKLDEYTFNSVSYENLLKDYKKFKEINK